MLNYISMNKELVKVEDFRFVIYILPQKLWKYRDEQIRIKYE